MSEQDDKIPVVLTYDRYSAAKDRRSSFVVLAYCAGVIAAGLGYAVIGFFAVASDNATIFSRVLLGCVVPVAFGGISLLPGLLSLGITMWVKQKIFREVRYRRPRTGFIWGAVAGAYPWMLQAWGKISDDATIVLFIGALIWMCLFPAVAGMFLCYRSHVRE